MFVERNVSDYRICWSGVGEGLLPDPGVPVLFPAPAPPPPQSQPPTLQNVETFGSFLGEEIVANWRRSLERTILSQGSGAQQMPLPGRVVPPPSDARSSSSAPVHSPVNATPSPSQTPDHPDITGKCFFNKSTVCLF